MTRDKLISLLHDAGMKDHIGGSIAALAEFLIGESPAPAPVVWHKSASTPSNTECGNFTKGERWTSHKEQVDCPACLAAMSPPPETKPTQPTRGERVAEKIEINYETPVRSREIWTSGLRHDIAVAIDSEITDLVERCAKIAARKSEAAAAEIRLHGKDNG